MRRRRHRLWPASREVRPKQFLPLFGTRSTFQDTLLRVSDASLFDRPIVITNASYRFMVLEQLAEIGIEADVILEPMRRNSGPAIAAGAAFAQNRASEAMVLALATNRGVQENAAFVAACRDEGGSVTHDVVGGERKHHRILIASLRKGGARRDRRSDIPPHRLEQHVGLDADLGELLQHHEAIGGIGDDDRAREQRGIGDTR